MSTPVVTSKWAGTYDCATCRRKRLMGEEFSNKALERHRRDGTPLKCKQCVAAAEKEERDRAAARRDAAGGGNGGGEVSDERRICAGKCGRALAQAAYNRNQWSKGEKARCRECVEQSLKDEAAQQSKSKEEKLSAARKKVERATKSGSAQEIVAAESELAALEAERVTGLKPVKLSSGRGGRGRGRSGRFGGRGGRR